MRGSKRTTGKQLGAAVALCALAVANATSAQGGPPRPKQRVAVLIGVNDPGRQDKALRKLRFADDDAIRSEQVLKLLGAKTHLVTSPDSDTKAYYPGSASKDSIRDRLPGAFEAAVRDVKELHVQGDVEVIVWFAGHGGEDADEGEWSLFLDQGEALTLEELEEQLLQPAVKAGARYVHVVIDACNAGHFLGRRDDDDRDEVRAAMLEGSPQAIQDRNPAVGFIWATTEDQKAWEWVEYRGGVFGHQLRSALLAAADTSHEGPDQAVSYWEAAAFVENANFMVESVEARMSPHVVLPQDEDVSLVDWKEARRSPAVLSMPPGVDRHVWVSERVLDAKAANRREIPLIETLRAGRDLAELVLPIDRELRVQIKEGEAPPFTAFVTPYSGQRLSLEDLRRASASEPQPDARGEREVANALREGLFKVAYGSVELARYVRDQNQRKDGESYVDAPVTRGADVFSNPPSALSIGLMAGGGALLAAGAITHVMSNNRHDDFERATGTRRSELENQTRTLDWTATLCLIAGGVGTVAGLGFWAFDDRTGPTVQSSARGVQLAWTGSIDL